MSSTFSLDSPYLFVQSSAVTDDPIKIDVTSSEFIDFMDMLQGLDYYDFINQNIQAEEEKPDEEKIIVEEAKEAEEAETVQDETSLTPDTTDTGTTIPAGTETEYVLPNQ